MQAENFSLALYTKRIGYNGPLAANLATLTALMRHQLFAIPFENLDVQAGKIVSMVPEQIVDKLLHHARGGYCYEVNGVFAMALQALGIPYQLVAARPMFYPTRRPRTHMVIVAKVEGQSWLCDLGFGSYGIRAPIALSQLNTPIQQDHDQFLLTQSSDGQFLVQAWVDGHWANQFGFDLSLHEWVDFEPANYMNSTHPQAIFVQKLLLVKHTPEGRKILFGHTLKEIVHGVEHKRIVPHDALLDTITKEFGLSLEGITLVR